VAEKKHGGARAGAGRPKVTVEEPLKIDKGFAARVMGLVGKTIRGEPWTKITRETAKNAEEYALTFLNSGDVGVSKSFFDKLLDRRFGKPPQPIFNADTRESAPDVDFGDLPMPAHNQPAAPGKPN
jgi:hypothetical protein